MSARTALNHIEYAGAVVRHRRGVQRLHSTASDRTAAARTRSQTVARGAVSALERL